MTKTWKLMPASLNDVVEIEEFLGGNYFNEVVYSSVMEYDPLATRRYITEWLFGGDCVIARGEDDSIVGVFSTFITTTYYKQPECEVIIFYVRPDYRGTGLSREMAKYLVKIADIYEVGAIYTSSASGIGKTNTSLYANLFKKFGFQELGTELVRLKRV